MKKQIRAMMIGAHPDDCDFHCGGVALHYSRAGHEVRFLSMLDGSGGHYSMKPADIAARRKLETQAVAKLTNIEYEVWDIPDCELMADLPTRKRLVRSIREYAPNIVFCNRPNDYHADHRNASILVQDASYLLVVPNFCPDTPAMKRIPVILYYYDHLQNPPFQPDLVVDIDEVIERKFRMLDCHESQVYEWLPYIKGMLASVPSDPATRFEWLHEPRIPRGDKPLDEFMLKSNLTGTVSEYREASLAAKYRGKLIQRYGERGMKTLFAEAFSICEYGDALADDKTLLPF